MGRERRRFERIESLLSVRYSGKKGVFSGYAFTKDISEGGLGLPMTMAVPKRGLLELFITVPDDSLSAIRATARIKWIRRNMEHWKSPYSTGLRFLKINPTDKNRLLEYAKRHRWIKSGFEQELEGDKVPVLGGKEGFYL